MGRILPFYRTGGVVSGGGGGGGNTGVPLGPFNDWSELPASAAGGSLAGVTSLGPLNSYGIARYEAAGPVEWQLLLGFFGTLADLLTFAEPINSLALATVGTLLDDPESVRYQWDDTVPEWVRTPDPVEYIYAANTWGTLPTQDTIQADDEVIVGDLGYTHSSGRGQRHGNEWRLIEGKFQSVADMVDFDVANVVHTDAIGLVKAGGGHDEEAIAYSYQGGNWLRFGTTTTAGYAWDITDLTNIDPSGIGATQIGDFARYTNPTTSAIEVYRLRSVPAVGSINLTVWVPASIYGEAGLTIRGYLIGTETMPASGSSIQGYTVTASGGTASVTTSGGEVVMASTTATHFARLVSTYALTEDDRVYVRMNLRLSQASGVNMTFYNALYDNGTTKSQFITAQNPTAPAGNAGKYLPTTTGVVLVGSTAMIRSTGTAIGNTAELVEILADGTLEAGSPPNPNFMVNVSRNARPYFSMRRRAQTGTETGQHLLQVFNGANGAHTARFSYLYFMTY
jgi:hypothetical protein